MLIWLCTLCFALGFRIWAKTNERKVADAFILSLYRGKNDAAITLASSLINRLTAVHEFESEIVETLSPFTLALRFVYAVFALSLTNVDSRTPHAFILFDNEQQFYDLHDPDIFDFYRNWKSAFFWDGGKRRNALSSLL